MPAVASLRRLQRRAVALGVLAGGLALGGCVGGRLVFLAAPTPPERPWVLPEDAYPSQRLYRVEYEDAGEEAAFRLALYLERPDRFRLQAVADLGRRVWTLDLDGGRVTWIDHRARRVCRTDGERPVGPVPVADLPATALPRLLLGVLPADPAGEPEWGDGGGIAYRDARGQLWNGAVERLAAEGVAPAAGRLLWWTLLDGDGAPVAWWKVDGERATFTDRRSGRRLGWSEVAREPLAPLAPLGVPPGFAEINCGAPG